MYLRWRRRLAAPEDKAVRQEVLAPEEEEGGACAGGQSRLAKGAHARGGGGHAERACGRGPQARGVHANEMLDVGVGKKERQKRLLIVPPFLMSPFEPSPPSHC